MSKRFKSFTYFSLIFVLVLILAVGCSNSGENNKANNAAADQPTNSEEPADTSDTGNAAKISGDFEIQYFVGGYGDAWWKEVIAEFGEKYPDLNIKQSAGSKINEQMRPRWIQGNPPDVVYIDGAGSNEVQMVKDDQLLDITEWLSSAQNVDGEKLTDNLIAQAQDYDGKNFTLPLVFGSWGTFYDTALFEKNGWTAPTDWESFLAVSEKIKQAGISPYIHTGKYPYYILGGLVNSGIVAENGGDPAIVNDIVALKEGVFKSEPVMRALDKLVVLRDKEYLDKSGLALNHTDSQIQWLQHKDAFIANGLWLENEMKKDIPDGFKFGFIPSVMQSQGGKYIAIPYTNTIAIAKKAKNPEAAKAFLEFVFTKQSAVRWAELTGAIMNYKADLNTSQASEVVKMAMGYFNSDNTVVAPVVVLDADVQKVEEDSTVALLDGKITPEEWADRMEKAAAKSRGK